jgi:uncharacterized protein
VNIENRIWICTLPQHNPSNDTCENERKTRMALRIIKVLQNHLLILLGWFFIVLGIVGILVPILPTTPFLIVALALFSKSSPRFHRMLLTNAWFGPILKQWEENKTISRKTKYKAFFMIIVIFSISIALFKNTIEIQLLLMALAGILLFFIGRIKEQAG